MGCSFTVAPVLRRLGEIVQQWQAQQQKGAQQQGGPLKPEAAFYAALGKIS